MWRFRHETQAHMHIFKGMPVTLGLPTVTVGLKRFITDFTFPESTFHMVAI